MKKIILMLLIAFQIPLFGQTFDKEQFVVYENVLKELQTTENSAALEHKYDYVSLLLLDSTQTDLIEKTGYAFIDEFRNYAAGRYLSEQTVGFRTDKKEIRDLFRDKNSLDRILRCIKNYNSPDITSTTFDFPIYIKGNTAIFKTSEPTGSDTYFAKLEHGVLQINWLGGVTE